MTGLFLFAPSVAACLLLVVVLTVRWFLVPADQRRTEYLLITAMFTSLAGGLCEFISARMSPLRPLKYDLFVYRIDGFLGFQPSFLLGRLVAPHLWAMLVLQLVYGLIPTAAALALFLYIWRRDPDTSRVVFAFVLNVLFAPLFYLAFPVCGPQFAFPHFPSAAGFVVAHAIPLVAAPNGVPSIHFSTAILIWWFCRRWRWASVLSFCFLVGTLLATLASGQHYLLDLVVAVPYTALVLLVATGCQRYLHRRAVERHAHDEAIARPS
jgi:hypothetical protein